MTERTKFLRKLVDELGHFAAYDEQLLEACDIIDAQAREIDELHAQVASFNEGWTAAQKNEPFDDEKDDYWQQGWQIFDYSRLKEQLLGRQLCHEENGKLIRELYKQLAAKEKRIAELEKRPDFSAPTFDVSDLYQDDEQALGQKGGTNGD